MTDVVTYFVDGVAISHAFDRNIGSEIDPNDISTRVGSHGDVDQSIGYHAPLARCGRATDGGLRNA